MNTYCSITCTSLVTFGALLAAPSAQAADTSAYTLTTNINLVSQYRFRGIDQTWGQPAVQGGIDLSMPNGVYAGVWASNVSGNSYAGGSLELDLYAGYNGKFGEDFGYTIGGYGYVYPGANYDKAACPSAAFAAPCGLPSQNYDTFELNAGVSWKWLSYKLSVSTGDYFGANSSTGYSRGTRGTMYHDINVSWPVADGLTIAAHLGHTDVKAEYGAVNPDYSDYRVAVTKTFTSGWNASAAVVGATNDAFYRPPVGGLSAANGDTRDVNKPVLVLQVGRSF